MEAVDTTLLSLLPWSSQSQCRQVSIYSNDNNLMLMTGTTTEFMAAFSLDPLEKYHFLSFSLCLTGLFRLLSRHDTKFLDPGKKKKVPSTAIFLGSLTDSGHHFFSPPHSWPAKVFQIWKTFYWQDHCPPSVKLPMNMVFDGRFVVSIYFVDLLTT